MNKEMLREKALEEAVYSIVSCNDTDLTPAEILKAWQKGEELEGVSISELYEYCSPRYLAEECESKTLQFVRFINELLEEEVNA